VDFSVNLKLTNLDIPGGDKRGGDERMVFINVIAALWWLWLAGGLFCLGLAAYFMMRYLNPPQAETGQYFGGESSVFGATVNLALALLLGLIGLISLVLLIASGLIYLFHFNLAVFCFFSALVFLVILVVGLTSISRTFNLKEVNGT